MADAWGSNAFGHVYEAILVTNEKSVAMKVLNLRQKGALKSFFTECEALQKIRHRNLVKVLTTYSGVDLQGNEFKALVYAFMENGSLDSWLHPQAREVCPARHLRFQQSLNIARDMASVLQLSAPLLSNFSGSLRSEAEQCPTCRPLESDFGLARLLFKSGEDVVSTLSSSSSFNGTNDYIAPEYGMDSHPSSGGRCLYFWDAPTGDFPGKRHTDDMFNNDLNLHSYVKQAWPKRVTKISDPSMFLEKNGAVEQQLDELLVRSFQNGLLCSVELP
ncbi:hypothetical protein MLD38_003742 [Melastoma candidum]|uniref:Uncharacterized protein n=1 Tax=Melastoma candidum TaxID=119954 RepID=A0ACB9S3T9_9MYRT|nr:hypothetical protein MLD38_003742 [Melastoma candidum]